MKFQRNPRTSFVVPRSSLSERGGATGGAGYLQSPPRGGFGQFPPSSPTRVMSRGGSPSGSAVAPGWARLGPERAAALQSLELLGITMDFL